MDRKLQERLVGAIVLVFVAVLVIPEFLSGPRQQESITEGLELPAEGASDLKSVTIHMNQGPDTPQAPVANPESQESADESTGSTITAVPTPATTVSSTKQAASTGSTARKQSPTAATGSVDGWAVQVGSFSQRDNALRLANTLKQQGYAAQVSEHKNRGRTMHRVRIGPLKTRAEADTMAARLSREGQQAAVVSLP